MEKLTVITHWGMKTYLDGFMQERCNSIANALELHLSCIIPPICQWCPARNDQMILLKMALKIWWDLLAFIGWYNGSFGTARFTYWGQDKMDNISHTTFLNVFSSMKMFAFPLKFHWSLFLSIQLITFQHWFRQWLGAVQATSHYLNQWWLVYSCIYVTRPQWVK